MRASPLLAASVMVIACSGGAGTPDAGSSDAGAAPTGEPCPNEDPLGCEGRICLSGRGGQTYCSEYCEPGSCPSGFPCQRYLFGDDEGAPADSRDVCAPPCERDGQCPSGACDLSTGLCVPPADGTRPLGAPCGGASGVCEPTLVCEPVASQWICLRTCDPAEGPFCDDGSFCWSANVPGGGRCWPGGASEEGDPCSAHLDCARGLLCILRGGESTCQSGCDPNGVGPGCPDGTACMPLEGRPYGFCQ